VRGARSSFWACPENNAGLRALPAGTVLTADAGHNVHHEALPFLLDAMDESFLSRPGLLEISDVETRDGQKTWA
jgi:hypothetical protein